MKMNGKLPSLPVAHPLTLPDWWKHLFHLFRLIYYFPQTSNHFLSGEIQHTELDGQKSLHIKSQWKRLCHLFLCNCNQICAMTNTGTWDGGDIGWRVVSCTKPFYLSNTWCPLQGVQVYSCANAHCKFSQWAFKKHYNIRYKKNGVL